MDPVRTEHGHSVVARCFRQDCSRGDHGCLQPTILERASRRAHTRQRSKPKNFVLVDRFIGGDDDRIDWKKDSKIFPAQVSPRHGTVEPTDEGIAAPSGREPHGLGRSTRHRAMHFQPPCRALRRPNLQVCGRRNRQSHIWIVVLPRKI